jgi:hypothetical protein
VGRGNRGQVSEGSYRPAPFVWCATPAGFACRTAPAVGRWHVGRECPRARVAAAGGGRTAEELVPRDSKLLRRQEGVDQGGGGRPLRRRSDARAYLELATVPVGHVFAPSKRGYFFTLASTKCDIPNVLFLLCTINKYDLIT